MNGDGTHKQLPFGINFNTLWIVLVGLGAWYANYVTLGTTVAGHSKTLENAATVAQILDLRADLETGFRNTDVRLDAARNEYKATFDAVTARITLISDRVVDQGNRVSVMSESINNLRDLVQELRRQSGSRSFNSGTFSSVPSTVPIPSAR